MVDRCIIHCNHWTRIDAIERLKVSYSKSVKSLSGPIWYSIGATEFVFRYCLMYLCIDFHWWRANLISLCSWTHRRLQSCVGTQAKLGYAGLMHNCSVFWHYTTHYTYIRVCVSMHMLYIGVWEHATCLRIRSSWYENAKKNPGNARVCPGLQVPMAEPWLSITIQLSNDGFLNMALPLLNSYYIVWKSRIYPLP